MASLAKPVYYLLLLSIGAIALLFLASFFPVTGSYRFLIAQQSLSGSSIRSGSLVLVKPLSDYRIGDIIASGLSGNDRTPDIYRVLEVKKISGGGLVYGVEGSSGITGEEIPDEQVMGKILVSLPYIGQVVSSVKTPLGFLLVVVLPTIVIIYSEIANIKKEFQKMKEST